MPSCLLNCYFCKKGREATWVFITDFTVQWFFVKCKKKLKIQKKGSYLSNCGRFPLKLSLINSESCFWVLPLYLKTKNVIFICLLQLTNKWWKLFTIFIHTFIFNLLSYWNLKWLAFTISLEPGQPAHLCSLTRRYAVGWPTSRFELNIPPVNSALPYIILGTRE